MRILLSALLLFLTLTVSAEPKLVVVGGATNIRSGQTETSALVATVEDGEFLYCEWTDTERVTCRAQKWQNGSQVEGYVLRNTLQPVDTLDTESRKRLIEKVLKKQKELAERSRKTDVNDPLAHKATVSELEKYSETKYDPILGILPKHFCLTKDVSLLRSFLETKLADGGSADETPSDAIGECYICEPAIVLEQILQIKSKEQRSSLYDSIAFGLMNSYHRISGKDYATNGEYKKLKKRLDDEKKRDKKQK